MIVLGIESSCDETAAAVVQDGTTVLSNVVASSMSLHAQYGGVVPEIAARSHIEAIIPVITTALSDAAVDWSAIDAIAVTYGAGLGGSLLIGVLTARTLAICYTKPLYACNHVEGHVYANFLTTARMPGYVMPLAQPSFPLLAIIVSGGHSQLALFSGHRHYRLLGQTRDDAVGEAFDKVAKVLGLPYPGGPSIEAAARQGDPDGYRLPISKMPNKYDFSFSGVKTAVLRLAQKEIGEDYTFPSFKVSDRLSEAQKANIAASFQHTVFTDIALKASQAVAEFHPQSVVIAGGVAASQSLRAHLTAHLPLTLQAPDIKLCTDNAAMIATLGYYTAASGTQPSDPYTLDCQPNLSM